MPTSDAPSDLPVITPDGGPARPRRESRVAGVLLAAGTSSRYGDANKLLADLDGRPIVRHAADALLASGVDRVVVVLGHEADRVRDALADAGRGDGDATADVTFVENPDYANGQATSVARGVEAVRDADAAVFALGDMPFVRPETIDALIAAYRAGTWTALAAAFEGERGNPVLFDATHFDALADVAGDTGGKHVLLTGDGSALVETDDPGVRRDIDTPEEYEAARQE